MRKQTDVVSIVFRACPFCGSAPVVEFNSDSISISCSICKSTIPDEIYRGEQQVGYFELAPEHKIELTKALADRWNGKHKVGNGNDSILRMMKDY